MFDGRWRDAVDRTTKPVGTALHRRGITADVLTATGLVSASATAVLVASGHLHWAIVLLIITGMHDLLDGPVAKAAGTASVRGAFFDSVTDRVADAVLMGGVSWYLIDRREGHLAVLPLAVLGVTALISYQRAKAESLGLSAKGGLMERAERMILLGVGFIEAWLLVPVLWVLLALTTVTAIGRFVKVWNAASGKDEIIRRRLEAWRESRERRLGGADRLTVDARWKAWREARESSGAGVWGGVPRRDRVSEREARTSSASASMARWRARRRVLRVHESAGSSGAGARGSWRSTGPGGSTRSSGSGPESSSGTASS